MKGIVLCAGKGSRLYPLTHSRPKALIPIANRPLIAATLKSMAEAGIDELGIVVNPTEMDAFRRALGRHTLRLRRLVFVEQTEPLGLAHAVFCARDFVGNGPFAVVLGDNMFTWNAASLVDRFRRSQPDALLTTVRVDDPKRYGIVTLSGKRVVEIEEKPRRPRSNLAVAGLYFFRSSIFTAISGLAPSDRGELELTDAIRRLVREGRRVEAEAAPGWCQDVGTIHGLLNAHRLLLAEMEGQLVEGADLRETSVDGPVHVGPATVVEGSRLHGPVVIGSRCTIRDSEIGPYVSVGDGTRIEGCSLEQSIVLEGVVLRRVPGPLSSSLIGARSVVEPAEVGAVSDRFIVGDHGRLSFARARR